MNSWEAVAESSNSSNSLDYIFSGINSIVGGVANVGETIGNSLLKWKAYEGQLESYKSPQEIALIQAKQADIQRQQLQTMLLIGGAVILAVVLLK